MTEAEKKQALYEELKRLPRPDEGNCWEKCPYCGKTVWFAERVTSVHCDHCRKLIPIELLLPRKDPDEVNPDEGVWTERCPYCHKLAPVFGEIPFLLCRHCQERIPVKLLRLLEEPEPPKKRPWYKRLFRAK